MLIRASLSFGVCLHTASAVVLRRMNNTLYSNGLGCDLHQMGETFLHTVLQNAPFCIAKRTILERKTHRFRMQNAPF